MKKELDQQGNAPQKKSFSQFLKSVSKRQWIVLATVLFLVADIVIVVQILPMFTVPAGPRSSSAVTTAVTEIAETDPEITVETTLPSASETPAPTSAPTAPRQTASLLESIRDNYHHVPREQALALFDSIDCLSDILITHSMMEGLNFRQSPSSTHQFATCEMLLAYEIPNEAIYNYVEVYDTNMFELRICKGTDTNQYTVLASKPLPAGYTQVDTYDAMMKISDPKNNITQATLDQILAVGHVAPFINGSIAKYRAYACYGYIEVNRAGNIFYLPESKTFVMLVEDYSAELLYYSFHQIDDGTPFYNVAATFDLSVPLSPDASSNNYFPGSNW